MYQIALISEIWKLSAINGYVTHPFVRAWFFLFRVDVFSRKCWFKLMILSMNECNHGNRKEKTTALKLECFPT